MAATIDQPTVTLEIALNTTSTPTWTAIPGALYATWQRGRQDELGTVEPGTCTVLVDNGSGNLSPENTGSAYYPNLKVMRRLRLSLVYNSVTYRCFYGYIQSIDPVDNTVVDSNVQIVAIDFFKLLNREKISGTMAQQDAGARIGVVLDLVTTPGLTRSLETGTEPVLGGVLTDVVALQHINDILVGDRGVFFVAGDGTLTFHTRNHRFFTARSNTSQATFAQGASLPYRDLAYIYDDQFLYNDVEVTPTQTGEGQQVVTDATSDAAYGTGTLTISSDWLSYGQANSLAQWLVAGYKDPRPRVPSITIDADASPASLYPVLLGFEIGDRITVVKSNPGTLGISKQLWIENIACSFDAAGTTGLLCTLLLSDPQAYGSTPWRLDVTLLDSATPLGY